MSFKYSQNMLDYYNQKEQKDRLVKGIFQLEYIRTIEIIERYLTSNPLIIYDIGCGGGNYASYFAKKNHIVSVLDPIPKHIAQAKLLSDTQPTTPIKSFSIGDARDLPFQDNSADVVLLLGPLYHLLEKQERIVALKESKRVLKKRGVLIASYVTRLATTFLEGVALNMFARPDFVVKAKEMAKTGKIQGNDFFTDAYCHDPREIKPEIRKAGLSCEKIIPIEGIGCVLPNFDDWWNNRRQELIDLVKEYENIPTIIGLSSHLISILRK